METARPSVGPLVVARWSVAVAVLAGLGAGGFLGAQALLGQRRPDPAHVDSIADPAPSTTITTTTTTPRTTATTAPPDPADTLAIRVETDRSAQGAGELVAATATIRKDGKLYLEGAFADQAQADAFLERAGAIFGRENIVEAYVVDPAAPAPQVADVALDKPVLFERGTVEIHPDYISFLEACAGVLALNPNIVMSIAAYTDASGSAEVNLELSQERAQAIVDFYRQRDIGDDQLLATGLGEANPVADNDSEAGRSQNRRAMLHLLNVMDDGGTDDGGTDDGASDEEPGAGN